ncbi:MAG: hypothetical protein SF162_15890 [bacterium]|nr:hypothetical protein [bacterium]
MTERRRERAAAHDGQDAPRPSRRYQRPRRSFSWAGVLMGLALGIGAGLYWAWEVQPIREFDTEPWQLADDDRAAYIVAITLRYASTGDVGQAVQALIDLRLPGDPIQTVADTACQLATTGYLDSASGLNAIRAMLRFYQGQGRTGCADSIIPAADVLPTQIIEIQAPTNTPTLPPPATKTPTPGGLPGGTATPNLVIIPTSAPQSDFLYINATTYCDAAASGIIEVYVYQVNGATGVPGQAVRARWDGGESTFFTGLKPERGPAYADFQMEANVSYIVDMPGQADPLPQPLVAVTCTTPDGQRAVISYRVTFREVS